MSKNLLTLITVLTLTFTSSIWGQKNQQDQQQDEVYFNFNLKDHSNQQLLHMQIDKKREDSFAFFGTAKGSNFLGLGRYSLRSVLFEIKNLDLNKKLDPVVKKEDSTNKKVYIKSVDFKCFVENPEDDCRDSRNRNGNQRRAKKYAKFVVDLTYTKMNPNGYPKTLNLGLYRDAILDFKFISTDFCELNDALRQSIRMGENKLVDDPKNFGSHICKSRVAY